MSKQDQTKPSANKGRATKVTVEKLSFWIKNGWNVIMTGRHGVGKSAMGLAAFNNLGMKYLYFSAATMDPFIDFIGIPHFVKDGVNGEKVKLIVPEHIDVENVEAMMFDEFNRGHKKVKNAVMELIQFKSINGRKFPKLKCIIAAINPSDEDNIKYDVDEMDAAQMDRFHIQVELPYKVDEAFFTQKFGADVAKGACQWWNDLPEDVKIKVSPRRLDYALEIYLANGDMRDALPPTCNVSKLLEAIANAPLRDEVMKIVKSLDTAAGEKLLENSNKMEYVISLIHGGHSKVSGFFLPLLPEERISQLISDNGTILTTVIDKRHVCQKYADIIKSILDSNANNKLVKKIKKIVPKQEWQSITVKVTFSKEDVWEKVIGVKDYKTKQPNPSIFSYLTHHVEIYNGLYVETAYKMNPIPKLANLPSTFSRQEADVLLAFLEFATRGCRDSTIDARNNISEFFKGSFTILGVLRRCAVVLGVKDLLSREIKYPCLFAYINGYFSRHINRFSILTPTIKIQPTAGVVQKVNVQPPIYQHRRRGRPPKSSPFSSHLFNAVDDNIDKDLADAEVEDA
jgi:hypothetical protein